MTSDSDDLEEALRENLKLRSELADEVSKAKAASQRGVAYRNHPLPIGCPHDTPDECSELSRHLLDGLLEATARLCQGAPVLDG